MIVDVQSAVLYAQARANQLDEPITIYYIPDHNMYAFGKIGAQIEIQRLYPTAQIIRVIEMSPHHWLLDNEELV